MTLTIYQAGTLSGNPLAMRAGIETMKILSQPGQVRPHPLHASATTSSAPPLLLRPSSAPPPPLLRP